MKTSEHYLSFLNDIDDLAEDFCIFDCHPTPSKLVQNRGVTLEIRESGSCSDQNELCIFLSWEDVDDEGEFINREVQFPYRYLYEDWVKQECAYREKQRKIAEAKRKTQKEHEEKREHELYEQLKLKYERN